MPQVVEVFLTMNTCTISHWNEDSRFLRPFGTVGSPARWPSGQFDMLGLSGPVGQPALLELSAPFELVPQDVKIVTVRRLN
jgi:hypothetical protein